MALTKMQGIFGLFMILVIILLINPGFYNNMYNNILGRVFLIILMIFFAMNNVTLGLLVALIIIIGTNVYFIEGMENQSTDASKPTTIGDDTTVTSNVDSIQVTTRTDSSKDKKPGVDRQSLEETIASKPSNHTEVNKAHFKSEDVIASSPPSTVEKFTSQYSGV
jgi:hypothetical protein